MSNLQGRFKPIEIKSQDVFECNDNPRFHDLHMNKSNKRKLTLKKCKSYSKFCGCKPKILLVDDNDFNLMPLTILINQLFKIETDQACNGLQAVEMF